MAQKIVGFYKSREIAGRVKDELISAGFDHDDVRIYDGSDTPGFWDSVKETFGFADEEDRYLYQEAGRRGGVALLVDLDDADSPSEQRAIQIMQRYSPMDLEREAQQWKAEGWRQQAATTQPSTTASAASASARTTGTARAASATTSQQGKQVIPVVEEELQVGKRAVQTGGVRIHSRVTEKPVQEQVNLREERINVERRPVDRPVTDADDAFRERAVEVTARAEQAVVNKQARVVEEVVVNKDVQQRTQTVRDTVRRTDVQVDQAGGQDTQIADRFAQELAADTRYRGREWNTVETDARRSFEQRYPGSKWDEFKDAIHRGYEKVRQKV